jgi:carnitine-CoA ligase
MEIDVTPAANSSVDERRASDIVWRYRLERHATDRGDLPAFIFPMDDDLTWTWHEAHRRARSMARLLADHDITRGSFVAVMGENTPTLVSAFLGATLLGAVISPINTAFRGDSLQHMLRLSAATCAVIEPEYVERFGGLDLPDLRVVVVPRAQGQPSGLLPGRQQLVVHDVAADDEHGWDSPDPVLDIWDPYAMICTSGTTGLSKGVLSPYGQIHAATSYTMLPRVTVDDVFLLDAPLFHVGGMLTFHSALVTGACTVVMPRVHVSGYWDRVRRYGITHATPMVMRWLLSEPHSQGDIDNPLGKILISGWSAAVEEFCQRFGVDEAYGMFNMTETSSMLFQTHKPGSIGRQRSGAEVRVVDDHDRELPTGAVGELIVRCELPWEMNIGYHRMPEATLEAWRNGWFHTGDLVWKDEDGDFFFVDRKKDMIRVRGENVSSFEVEQAVLADPSIAACAAFAVVLPDGDEAVMVTVVGRDGAAPDPAQLVARVQPMLPYFAVPRFVDVVEALPSTTDQDLYGKVRKAALREQGVTPRTWDRAEAGITVNRDT